MKFAIPEISWHNRDPVLSVDFQPKTESNGPLRLATGGTDSHVLIWYMTISETGSVNLEVAADLTRHQKSVNVVRWSPNGLYLASGDDESIIFVWKQKTEEPTTPLEGEEVYKETWVIYKTLRGHMEDVLDICWNSTSSHLSSGSVDNKLILWDVHRGRYTDIVTDHKGFVQGVAWDPKGQYIATTSSDRVFRIIDVASKKVVSRSSKALLPFPKEHPLHNVKVRLYHDDTLQTYYRRLQFSPDGLLIAVPAGRIEPEQGKLDTKPINAVYIYTRYSLKVPVCVIPCAEPALAVRWSPVQYLPRGEPSSPASVGAKSASVGAESASVGAESASVVPESASPPGPPAAFPLAARSILAVATRRAVLLYDTQQRAPLALISNIHYTRLTDLAWAPDGRALVAASTDGFCSVITFAAAELGRPLPAEPVQEAEEPPNEVKTLEQPKTSNAGIPKINSYIKFKTPSEKSPKKSKIVTEQRTPVKLDVLMDSAMPSWSDNSSNDIIKPKESESMDVDKESEIMVIEDSEDMKLVYDDTEGRSQSQSPKEKPLANVNDGKKDDKTEKCSTETKVSPTQSVTPTSKANTFFQQARVTDVKEQAPLKPGASPRAPRRVSFVTLSSPKNKKKC